MSAKLFIRNLSWSVSEYDLQDLFGEVGEVVSVKIPTSRETGKPRGFAFVEMGSPELAQEAIQRFNGYSLDNRDLVVDFQDESRGRGSSSGAPTPSPKLFIRNIGYAVSEYDLEALFQKMGTVVSVTVPTDRDTGEQKGFAFIEMGSTDEAQQAIDTLNNTPLNGKEISVDFSNPNRSKSRPRQGGGGYSRSGGGGYGRGW